MIDYEQVEDAWHKQMPESGKGDLPVPEEQYLLQLRTNLMRDLPNIKNQKDHDITMVMVCGGPTAKNYLEEIRAKSTDPRYHVFCSNRTHDWLIENGIKPYCQFIIDPKEGKIKDVQNPQHGVKYILSVQCHPSLFEKLQGYDVYRLMSACGIKTKSGINDYNIVKGWLDDDTYTFHLGGTMAGLRAMTLAEIMGYMTVEFYGFDSCFFDYADNGVPNYYSYEKLREEDILEVKTSDGRTWLTSPVFASQARQYLKWKQRLGWMKFVIHGDSFTAALDRANELENARTHDRRFSDLHKMLNEKLHDKEEKYGTIAAHRFAGSIAILVGQLTKKYGPLTMLDYGCGKGLLYDLLPPITGLTTFKYDFAIPEYSADPKPADIVVCTDVLEHVEPDCVENVLDHLQYLTRKICFCSIAETPAEKTYSNGQNAHLSVHDSKWWYPKLRKRFDVAEQKHETGRSVFVLQKKGAEDIIA